MQDNFERADEDQQGENSKEQEQYDRKICPWFWDETDWWGDQVWLEMMTELTESVWDVRVSEDKKDDQNEVFCVWGK